MVLCASRGWPRRRASSPAPTAACGPSTWPRSCSGRRSSSPSTAPLVSGRHRRGRGPGVPAVGGDGIGFRLAAVDGRRWPSASWAVWPASAYSWALLLTPVPRWPPPGGAGRLAAGPPRPGTARRAAPGGPGRPRLGRVRPTSRTPSPRSARELLDCRAARIAETPPGDGELGSRLPGRWLPGAVAGRRRTAVASSRSGPTTPSCSTPWSPWAPAPSRTPALVEQLKHEAFHDALTGPAQPAAVRGDASAWRWPSGASRSGSWRSSSSTSTASSGSTTAWATRRATSCCGRSPGG